MTTATRVESEPDADDLRDAECDNCCGTGAVLDFASAEEWSRCPVCLPGSTGDRSPDPVVGTSSVRGVADGSDSAIRTSRLASGSRPPPRLPSDPDVAVLALEDLRLAVQDARTSHARAEVDVGRRQVSSSCLISLADRVLEYLEAESRFREASCAVMRGASPASADLPECTRRVAIAEVALRTVASAGLTSPGEAVLGACEGHDAIDPSRSGAISSSDVGIRATGRWWSRFWSRSRTVSVRSGGGLT